MHVIIRATVLSCVPSMRSTTFILDTFILSTIAISVATPVWTDFSAVCEALNSSAAGHDDERGCSEKSFLATAEVVGRDAARARCRSTCAPYSTGHWCQNLGARCRWPQLNTIVEAGTGALLRPFQ